MPYILSIRTIAIVNTAVNGMNMMIQHVQNVGEIHKLTTDFDKILAFT